MVTTRGSKRKAVASGGDGDGEFAPPPAPPKQPKAKKTKKGRKATSEGGSEASSTPAPSGPRSSAPRSNPLAFRGTNPAKFDDEDPDDANDAGQAIATSAPTAGTHAALRAARIKQLLRWKVRRCEIAPQFRKAVFDKFLEDENKTPAQKLMATRRLAQRYATLQAYLPRDCWKPSIFAAFWDSSEDWLRADYPSNPFRVVRFMVDGGKRALEVFNLQPAAELIAAFLGTGSFLRDWGTRYGGYAELDSWRQAAPTEPYATALLQRDDVPALVAAWISTTATARLAELGLPLTRVNAIARTEIVQRAKVRPSHALAGKAAAVEQIVAMAQSSPEQRREQLTAALTAKGLALRSDSKLCKGWIDMRIGAVLEEVVGIMQIARTLFDVSHIAWSHNHEEWEDELREQVLDGEFTWEESLEQVLENEVQYDDSEDEYDDSDSEDDDDDDGWGGYGGGGYGYRGRGDCWSCGGSFPCAGCGRGYPYY